MHAKTGGAHLLLASVCAIDALGDISIKSGNWYCVGGLMDASLIHCKGIEV